MVKIKQQPNKWWVLFAMTSCISMIFIDITVLPVALPTIQRTLGLSEVGLQWIINAYTLALTVFLLAGGRLGDRYGYRKIFSIGLFTFALSSALCGLSYSETWFIASRMLQGVGGAMLIPTSTAIIFSSFPPQQRGKAMGLYVSIGSIFLAMGPVIGGVLTQYYTWRLVFWINLPIALIGYTFTLLFVPKFKGSGRHFDLVGFFISLFGVSSIVVGLMEGKVWGWTSPWTLGLLLFGIGLLFLLYRYDRGMDDPYIDFTLFRNRKFVGANFSNFCTQFLLMITIFWAVYFQIILGFSPAKAGTLSLISNIPIMFAAPLAGHLLDKRGPRLPIAIGFTLVIFSLTWFFINIGSGNIPLILSAIIPFGCGIPFIFTPSFTTAMAEVPTERRGLASGTYSMVRQLGATLGLGVIGTLFLNIENAKIQAAFAKNAATAKLTPDDFQGLLAKTPKALAKLESFPDTVQEYIQQSFFGGYLAGFKAINLFVIFIGILGITLALSFINTGRVASQRK